MNAQTDTPYAPSAYRSDNEEPLPPPLRRKDANRSGFFDTHLAFGHYARLEPEMEVTVQLECEEHTVFQRQMDEGEKQGIYCDAKRWRFQNSSKISLLLSIAQMMSYPFSWSIWVVGILSSFIPGRDVDKHLRDLSLLTFAVISVVLFCGSLALYIKRDKRVNWAQAIGFFVCAVIVSVKTGSIWGHHELQVSLWLGAALFFMGAFGFNALFWLHNKISNYDGSEFNRTDGMVRFKRRFRKLFVAPFEEFDPVLQLLPSGYGSHDYAIWLHHRYSNNKVCLATKVHSLGLNQANAMAFWDCLQRYMDVTQPLPDLPVLEQTRHLDPVTAAHDAQTGRNPRRWRDQALEDWKANGSKHLRQQLQVRPWQVHPCIIKARIEPTLCIRTYYRTQGAKGIHSTPGAEYFRGVRT